MIISASKRTDIPAFYSTWFYNRVEEGFVDVVNPFNSNQISRISLDPQDVEALIFWTKDARPMMEDFYKLDRYEKRICFQYTITGYNKDIEKMINDKVGVIENFRELSRILGPKKMVLRYDPILITEKYTVTYHIRAFEKLLSELSGYVEKCMISFLDIYAKSERNMRGIRYRVPTKEEEIEIAKSFSEIGRKYKIRVETCAEESDLKEYGITHGGCVSEELMTYVAYGENYKKYYTNKKQKERVGCNCIKHRDIGGYNTCSHGCVYCYANYNLETVKRNFCSHDPNETYLGMPPGEEAKIMELKKENILLIKPKENHKLFK